MCGRIYACMHVLMNVRMYTSNTCGGRGELSRMRKGLERRRQAKRRRGQDQGEESGDVMEDEKGREL